jgi:hypothetical protein
MKRLQRHFTNMKKLALSLALSLVGLVFPDSARGQVTYVSLLTVPQQLFTNTPCTGSPQTAVINNLGQISHSLVQTFTAGNPTKNIMFLEGSNDGITFTRFSDEFDGNTFGQLQAAGYFNVVRANVTCAPAGTTSFSLTYGGSGVPQNQPTGDGLRSQMEKSLINGVTATTVQSGTVRTPYGNFSGLLLVGTNGSFSGSASISVSCVYIQGSSTAQVFSLSGSQASFIVPASPCAQISWNYAPGTSTGTMGAEYFFSAGFSGASGASASATANACALSSGAATTTGCLIAGKDSQTGTVTIITADNGATPGPGMAIGLGGSGLGGNGGTYPNGISPLIVVLEGQSSGAGSGTDLPIQASQGNCVVTTSNCNGIFTVSSGYGKQATVTALTSNLNANLWGAVGTGITDRGVLQECWFSVQVTAASGTTPTMDVYFQDGPDGSAFNDRAHLPQFTTTGSAAGGISGGGVGFTPAVFQSGVLAASTKIDGPIGPYGNLFFKLGGTTPSFTFVYTVACR